MKKLIFLIIFNFMCLLVVAQSNIRLNNYWGNAHYINPASVYDKYLAVFSMTARKQWFGFTGAPSTFFASGTTYIDDLHTQFGLILVQDQIGYTATTNIDFSYAYAIMLERDWQLHLGMGLNYQSLNYDISKVRLITDDEPDIYEHLKTENSFNADIGIEFTNKSVKFGASSLNIFSVFSPENKLQPNTNFLYARYRENSDKLVNLGVGVCGIQYENFYQMEFNLTSYFKISERSGLSDNPDLFDIGLFYRTQSEVGVILGFDITQAIHLSYSYDYHVRDISRSSYGTNELMITFNLQKKKLCHNCWF